MAEPVASKTADKLPLASEPSTSKGKRGASTKNKTQESVDTSILSCLKQIQHNQKSYDEKVDSLMDRLKNLEYASNGPYDPYYDQECYYYEGDDQDGYDDSSQTQKDDDPSSLSRKRESESNSRFASMAKRFKGKEVTSDAIDSHLADNVNDLFRKGIDEEQYAQMMKDDQIPRPENCEALVTVKCNKLIWDVCQTNTKFIDKKLQNTETSLIKGSILVAQSVDKLAELEAEAKEKGLKFDSVIDKCSDALSLFGQANRQLNMTRREILKPELKAEYGHLCNPSVPYTSELFGDDLSKTARELEDTMKMGHRIQQGYYGSQYHRPPARGRGFRGRSRGRGFGFHGRRGAPHPYYSGTEGKTGAAVGVSDHPVSQKA